MLLGVAFNLLYHVDYNCLRQYIFLTVCDDMLYLTCVEMWLMSCVVVTR